jgi:hypothetical protein
MHHIDGLIAIGNQATNKVDVAMDSLYGLDNSRYAKFKAQIVNDIKGILTQPEDIKKIYPIATRQVAAEKEAATAAK